MENKDQILEFLDGSLDSTQEEELFLSMSSSEELRSELKHQVAIKSAVKSDSTAFMPDPMSTVKLYSKLGFIPESAAVTGGAAGKKGLFNFLSKNKGGILSSLMTAALTAFVMFMLLKPGTEEFQSEGLQKASQSMTAKDRDGSDNQKRAGGDVPFVSSRENKQAVIRDTVREVKYVYLKEKSTESSGRDAKLDEISRTSDELASSLNQHVTMQSLKTSRISTLPEVPLMAKVEKPVRAIELIPDTDDPTIDTDPGVNWSIELRGIQPWSFPEPEIAPRNYQAFNNVAVGGVIHISDAFSVIPMEYRRENFYQEFTGKDKFGNIWEYKQQPNFWTLSLGVRWTPNLFNIEWLKPVGQITGGGNVGGVVGRGFIGAKIIATNKVSFLLGGEYTHYRYMHQNNWFSTEKLGVHYGITYYMGHLD